MSVHGIFGAQGGDEGKGKIVDEKASDVDYVIRAQGGDNAGHTIHNEYGKFVQHLIPSGIFYPHVKNVLGAGMVVNPFSLIEEMDVLIKAGITLDNLYISRRAHLVLPHHIWFDKQREGSKVSLGSTKKGISPAYSDKMLKINIRYEHLLNTDILRDMIDKLYDTYRDMYGVDLGHLYEGETDKKRGSVLYNLLVGCIDRLKPHIIDDFEMIQDALSLNKKILVEGQLGGIKDIDWGMYPYCTSSSVHAGAIVTGAGIPATKIDRLTGVSKAYYTLVGSPDEPFPSEMTEKDATRVRSIGKEYGATTGRPRRCGWFDAVQAKYVSRLNGFTDIALTKLDVLSEFDVIKICTGYNIDEKIYTDTIPSVWDMHRVTPIYEVCPGWKKDISSVRILTDLPVDALKYTLRLQTLLGIPISSISVGPERHQTINIGSIGVW